MKKRIISLFLFTGVLFLSTNIFSSESSRYLVEIGKKYYKEGNYEQAAIEFEKAVQADAEDLVARSYLKLVASKTKESKKPLEARPSVDTSRKKAVEELLDAIEQQKTSAGKNILAQNAPNKPAEALEKAAEQAKKSAKEEHLMFGPLKIYGDLQLSFGIEDGNFYW